MQLFKCGGKVAYIVYQYYCLWYDGCNVKKDVIVILFLKLQSVKIQYYRNLNILIIA